ncbi:MAG TPA: MTH938/NDUFAF3 family protein [Anaerolineae bacterium]|jgi:hypothetical protein|nr:MTH938/NDUFAF3 family protein [Anaerolineae bacterium]
MHAQLRAFGVLEIDGRRYEHDVVIEKGRVRKRKKGPSRAHRQGYGHTPLSADEAIPWSAPRLIIGTGASGQLPIMPAVYAQAERRGVDVIAEPTASACERLRDLDPASYAAILHVTC